MKSDNNFKPGDLIRVWVANRKQPFEGRYYVRTEDALIWRTLANSLQGKHLKEIEKVEKVEERR
jgi:hypothetical protein